MILASYNTLYHSAYVRDVFGSLIYFDMIFTMHKESRQHIIGLRVLHGILTVYFTFCLIYLYIVGLTGNVNSALFIITTLSLALEGVAVFAFNKGDCPLIHVQRKIGDEKPFFELLFPPKAAKQAIPVFALLTIVAILILLIRFVK